VPDNELDMFARFCSALELEQGGPMALEPFQQQILAEYFAGARETLVLLPKKNGKSTLLAALALYHLLTTPDAECVIAAASRDQAMILFDAAVGFVRRAPGLGRRVKMQRGYRQIRNLADSGRIRVLAADVDTADGVRPTLALVDELHRHRSADLYGLFRDGLGPRQGRMVTISTAGDDEESPLGTLRRAAYRLTLVKRDGAYRRCASPDGAYVMHEWALEPEEDRHDMAAVNAANPASWQTLEALTGRHDSPSMTEWQWARFACGVWLQGEDTAIGPVEWSACGTDPAGFPEPAGTVRLGIDLGTKEDTTAIAVHWLDEDGVAWIPQVTVLVPPAAKGVGLRKADIIEQVRALADTYQAGQVVIDEETGGWIFGEDIEDQLGLEVVAHSQKPAPMAEAAERFYTAVREEKVRHPRDHVFSRHVLNAHRRGTDDGRWRFVKENKQSKKVIDGLIAAAMAHNIAVEEAESVPPMIEVFG
jgi:phage terminase large subunit-like protein